MIIFLPLGLCLSLSCPGMHGSSLSAGDDGARARAHRPPPHGASTRPARRRLQRSLQGRPCCLHMALMLLLCPQIWSLVGCCSRFTAGAGCCSCGRARRGSGGCGRSAVSGSPPDPPRPLLHAPKSLQNARGALHPGAGPQGRGAEGQAAGDAGAAPAAPDGSWCPSDSARPRSHHCSLPSPCLTPRSLPHLPHTTHTPRHGSQGALPTDGPGALAAAPSSLAAPPQLIGGRRSGMGRAQRRPRRGTAGGQSTTRRSRVAPAPLATLRRAWGSRQRPWRPPPQCRNTMSAPISGLGARATARPAPQPPALPSTRPCRPPRPPGCPQEARRQEGEMGRRQGGRAARWPALAGDARAAGDAGYAPFPRASVLAWHQPASTAGGHTSSSASAPSGLPQRSSSRASAALVPRCRNRRQVPLPPHPHPHRNPAGGAGQEARCGQEGCGQEARRQEARCQEARCGQEGAQRLQGQWGRWASTRSKHSLAQHPASAS